MARLQHTEGLTEDQTELVKLVRTFVDEQIIPVAMELERKRPPPHRAKLWSSPPA